MTRETELAAALEPFAEVARLLGNMPDGALTVLKLNVPDLIKNPLAAQSTSGGIVGSSAICWSLVAGDFRRAAAALATQAKGGEEMLTLNIERDETLWVVTSPQIKGLLVAEHSLADVLRSVPVQIENLNRASATVANDVTKADPAGNAAPPRDESGLHSTQAPPEPAGERAWLRENVLKVLRDKRQRTGLIVNMCGAPPGGVAHNVVTFILDAAERAATTHPQPLDGVTEVLREFVAWAARSKDVDYLNGESDIHSGDAWVHLAELVLRAQSALRVIGAPEIGRPSASPS